LRQKLPHVDNFNKARLRVAATYCDKLQDLDIQLPVLKAPEVHGKAIPVFHQFTLLTNKRDTVKQALADANIASAVYYPIPLHQQTALTQLTSVNNPCPTAEAIAQRCLSLPIYPEMPDESINRVCANQA